MTGLGRPITRRAMLGLGAGVALGCFGLDSTALAREVARRPRWSPGWVNLTPAQQAGQRVIFSYPGATPPPSLLNQISSGQAGGVMFFRENVTSPTHLAGVIAQLKAAHDANPVSAPLLFMTDQEGGQVRRIPGEPSMSEKQIGASPDPSGAAARAGTAAGQNLRGLGMNVNLAPVLDVYRQAGDFDDREGRSYSSDPNVVAQCGSAFITAQQQLGVAGAAKHFPGLGTAATNQNTDDVPVTLDVSLQDLRNIDEAPFVQAIAAGAEPVMASWALYPALDPKLPAGLSPTVIGGELRQRLNFDGVTITDALEAGAIRAYGSPAQCGVLAAKAGMDLLLASGRDVGQGQDTVAALTGALQSQDLDPVEFDSSLTRVLAWRNSF